MTTPYFPTGRDAARVRAVIPHHDQQTNSEAIAKPEAALKNEE